MIGLLLPLLLQAAPAAPPPAGWTFRESANAETGVRSASATVRDPDSGSRLIVKCDVVQRPIVSIQFIPRPAMAAGPVKTVTLTLDSARAEMSGWQFPGSGAYVGDPPTVFLYASFFAGARQIEVGLTDDAGNPVGGRFAGPGDDGLFRQVFAACGTPYAMPSATAKTVE